jgi:hypothetical protein
VTGMMKVIVVVLVVVGVWIAASFLFGELIFSSMGPSQPVVRTHLPPKPTNNSTAAAVINSSIDIGAAVRGLHGAPYPVVNLSVPSGALVDYLLPDGQYSAVVQT